MKRYVIKPTAPTQQLDYAARLNPQQLEVVTAKDKILLVLAGAGSGKTRVVTHRVAYLIEQGVPPESILLLTFTNKASQAMLRRVGELIAIDARRIWGGTYHRVANLILRRHAQQLGFSSSYTILDTEDSKDTLAGVIDKLGLQNRATRFPRSGVVLSVLSYVVNTQRPLSEVLAERLPVFADCEQEFADISSLYAEHKRAANALDYDDLLVLLLDLLRGDAAIKKEYNRRFRHILVDEYQDSNRLQAAIVDLLAEQRHSLMVVGDDAQSIFSFRGAEFANIVAFPEHYPNARCLKLETNYRSTPEVLALANHVIAQNETQFAKTLRALRPQGGLPALVRVQDTAREASFVGQRILELIDEGLPLNEIAILYRAHWHSLDLQMELTRRRIPFEVRSGIRIFEAAHVKDVLAHLRIVTNPQDELSWRRVLKLLPKVGARTAERLVEAMKTEINPVDALERGVYDAKIPKAARRAFELFKTGLREMNGPTLRVNAAEMMRTVVRGEYASYLYARYEDAERRLQELEQLAAFAESFGEPELFLSELALSSNLEAESLSGSDGDEKLVLSTVHQAKGLEWQAVFVIGLTDGHFPSARSLREGEEEEERRLFYVAVTRAKDELYLLYPMVAFDESRHQVMATPSRFVQNLGPDLVEPWSAAEEPYGGYDDDIEEPIDYDQY